MTLEDYFWMHFNHSERQCRCENQNLQLVGKLQIDENTDSLFETDIGGRIIGMFECRECKMSSKYCVLISKDLWKECNCQPDCVVEQA